MPNDIGVVALAVALGVAASAGVGSTGLGLAGAVDLDGAVGPRSGPTALDDCTTITDPGRYVLAGDVRNASPADPESGLGACIEVRADDVTLDGAGRTVAAGPSGAPGVVGVLVSGANVTIHDLTTTRWGGGVAVVRAEDTTLRNVSAVDNLGDGVFVENAPGVTVRGGVVRSDNTGLFVRNAPDATIADVTATENLAGVALRASDGATVRGVDVDRNRRYGVGVLGSANVTVADAAFRGNAFADVALASADARLRGLTLSAAAVARGWAVYAANDSTATGERVRVGRTRLSFEVRDAALAPADETPSLSVTDRQVVGDALFVRPTDADARVSLSVGYADAAVERARTTEDGLSLWRYDVGEGWTSVETTVDADRNAASATLGTLTGNGTVVALVGEGLAEAENETATRRRRRRGTPSGPRPPRSSPRSRRTGRAVRR